MPSSLPELNTLLDNFVPKAEQAHDLEKLAKLKEAEALEKILARVWLAMSYFHENEEPGQCPIIHRSERIPYGNDSGLVSPTG